ncbi:MAG: Hsp70 family protein [Magnetococcales bacterium]|nr:Hsp70 family protein [Magnetococcales bacterium]
MAKEAVIGIDLGTTNSEVAVYQQGRVTVIPDAEGRKILPSFVGVTAEGTLLVGEEARNQYIVFPERTVRSIKRRMGETEPVSMAGQNYLPQEISAIILKRLKATAEAYLGQPVQKAVITVPAYFSDAQRQATREAGEIAGLDVLRMINEPTAAALVYEAGKQEGKKILVYDLGGGTFDVSVVRIEQGVVEVISSHGDNHLGGDDFDEKIVEHLLAQLQESHGVDAATDPRALARLRRAAEAAKRVLSDHPYARIDEEYLQEVQGKPIHLSVELSRIDYEEMITPFIDRTLEAVHIALRGAQLTTSAVESILLVGGATRTPLVVRRLEEIFGVRPRGEVDPDLCVAMGAAIQAASVQGEEVSAVLVDITPYTFGVSAVGQLNGMTSSDLFVPVIHKNSAIPTHKSEVFYTMMEDQPEVEVRIFQGENKDARKNRLIGEFMVEGLSRAPANSPVVLRMDLDADGLLHVSATEKKSGLSKRITIGDALRHLDAAEMAGARTRLDHLFGENDDGAGGAGARPAGGHQEEVMARALLEKAERMLEQAAEADQEEMINLIEDIRQALTDGDQDALAEPCEALSEILFYLET